MKCVCKIIGPFGPFRQTATPTLLQSEHRSKLCIKSSAAARRRQTRMVWREREELVSSHRLSIAALACALLCSTSMHAQPTSAAGPVALQGTVSSSQEGAMEGVLVSAKKTGSTITTTVVTDEKGHYGFPASRLEPGHYDITIRAVGYKL